jgi:hypothetical protein
MRSLFKNPAVVAALGVLLMGSSWAQDASPLPPVQSSGSVEYLTGGVGSDESKAIEQASRQWPLTLEFAVKNQNRADFAADVKTAIRSTDGRSVIQLDSAGPIVLAKLSPGRYTVDATLAGKTLHERVNVKPGQHAKAVFVWPEGTDEGSA